MEMKSHIMARLNKRDKEMLAYLAESELYGNPTDFVRSAIKKAYFEAASVDEEMEECESCGEILNRNLIYPCCACGKRCCKDCLRITSVMTCEGC